MISLAEKKFFPSFTAAIRTLYQKGQGDETLEPIIRYNSYYQPVGRLEDGDSVIFYDLRGEREIELTQSLTEEDFPHFQRRKFPKLFFVTLVAYAPSLKVKVAFPNEVELRNTLVETVCRHGLRVVKITESEKAAHLGFFLNGKREATFPGEERIIIPSSTLDSHENEPEMKAEEISQEVIRRIKERSHHLIIANLANVDVIGHYENKEAVIRAVEKVDSCLGKIVTACSQAQVCLIVTADHGTVEEWLYPEGAINTGHTKNPVPFILGDFRFKEATKIKLKERGELADVAPTVLELLGLPKPEEMTGKSLILNPPRNVPSEKKERISNFYNRNSFSQAPLVLLILDGWGIRENTYGNLITEALTPNFDFLWFTFPHSLLEASGEAVGLPPGTVGNSEAGHLHLGAGRRLWLDRVRIDHSLADGSFFKNEILLEAMSRALLSNHSLHLMGIVSHYSSHGTIRHLFGLLEMARAQDLKKVYIHAFIGRRGERPESGIHYMKKVQEKTKELNCGELVTVMGRYWSLDREKNWDRIERAYRALVEGDGYAVCPEIFGSEKLEE